MGNGILTFMHSAAGYQRFSSDAQAVFFNDDAQLQQQLRHFQHDDAARKQVAGAGRLIYQREFSGQQVAQFMIETTFDQPYSCIPLARSGVSTLIQCSLKVISAKNC